MVPFFPPTVLVFAEKVNLPQSVVEVHCWEHQLVEFPWLKNMVVFVIQPLHEHVIVVLLIMIAF